MKKTLMALCVVMASGSAMAWTTGDFNGTVDFGGSITPEQYGQQWEWESGTGLNNFVNTVKDLTDDAKKLAITADKDYPILKGRTTAAFSTGEGNIPSIAFSDYEGQSVSLHQDTSSAEGTGYFDLPIKDESNQKIGTLHVNATAAGMVVGKYDGGPARTSVTAESTGDMFFGGLFNKVIPNALHVSEFIGKYTVSSGALMNQVTSADSTMKKYWTGNYTWANKLNAQPSALNFPLAAVYVMLIQQGQTLAATFDSSITSATKWSAPLNISVTYN